MGMKLIYIAAFVSFVSGTFGYIIVRFWVIPITRYRKHKQGVAATLSRYADARTSENAGDAITEDFSAALRKHAADLSDAFNLDVPHWYRMLLKSRGESPIDAARLLMKLANTRIAAHRERQIDRIRDALRL